MAQILRPLGVCNQYTGVLESVFRFKQTKTGTPVAAVVATAKLIHSLLYKYPSYAAVTLSGKGSWSERLDCRLRSVVDRLVRSSRVCYVKEKNNFFFFTPIYVFEKFCLPHHPRVGRHSSGWDQSPGICVPRWRQILRLGYILITFFKWGRVDLWRITAL